MSTATLERLPNTVTACHAMIRKLAGAEPDDKAMSDLKADIEQKDLEIQELSAKLSASEERVEELEKEVEERADPIDAIDQFLYEVQRPVGQLKFDVIHGGAADRAILRLYDAAGRNP